MADPTSYEPGYSFSSFQSSSPSTPLPAPQVDNELINISTAVVSLVNAVKNVRREDGALNNGLVTFDSLDLAVQLMLDPSNATLVADAVAEAQAAATAAGASATSASGSAAAALASALAAAASAASVNLSLYLPKAGNFAGIGNVDTALSNIQAAKLDGTNVTGRLAPATGYNVTDWDTAVTSGWFAGDSAANGPTTSQWLVQVIAFSPLWVTQIAYPFVSAATGTSAVTPMRRHSYNSSGSIAWQPWESMGPVQVGSTIWVNGTSAPPGYVKENGALLSRATYPALWTYANASGNIVSEASWSANSGAFSTGDLSTTFRIPDARGEFIRGYDDGRGADSGRVMGAWQADSLKSHTHNYSNWNGGAANAGGGVGGAEVPNTATSGPSTGAATETRPRNIVKLACIKF